MSLSVIGAGFGRTGTLSIKAALESLGFGPCYHMEQVFESDEQLRRWRDIAAGAPPDWHEVFADYRSTVDWPGTLYWRQLAGTYPDARVLLSVRPEDSWWRSFSTTIKKLIESRDTIDDEGRRSVLEYANDIINLQTFGGAMHDKDAVMAAYRARIDEVVAETDPERLLVFDVAEGWGPLCAFLGVAQPDKSFPHINNRQEFWQQFGPGETS